MFSSPVRADSPGCPPGSRTKSSTSVDCRATAVRHRHRLTPPRQAQNTTTQTQALPVVAGEDHMLIKALAASDRAPVLVQTRIVGLRAARPGDQEYLLLQSTARGAFGSSASCSSQASVKHPRFPTRAINRLATMQGDPMSDEDNPFLTMRVHDTLTATGWSTPPSFASPSSTGSSTWTASSRPGTASRRSPMWSASGGAA